MQKYAWLEKTVKTEDLEKIAVNLSKTQQDEVKYEIDAHIEYANSILNSYCSEQNIFNRQMSRCDCELLATGIVLDALIATDEWPFNFVVEDLLSIPEEGYKIKVITSLHILHLLEQDGSITANDRRNTIRSWLQNDEKLRSDWRKLYRQLFKEKAPTL